MYDDRIIGLAQLPLDLTLKKKISKKRRSFWLMANGYLFTVDLGSYI
jgi:hypothetical protein